MSTRDVKYFFFYGKSKHCDSCRIHFASHFFFYMFFFWCTAVYRHTNIQASVPPDAQVHRFQLTIIIIPFPHFKREEHMLFGFGLLLCYFFFPSWKCFFTVGFWRNNSFTLSVHIACYDGSPVGSLIGFKVGWLSRLITEQCYKVKVVWVWGVWDFVWCFKVFLIALLNDFNYWFDWVATLLSLRQPLRSN
jgi:hypothetical protein